MRATQKDLCDPLQVKRPLREASVVGGRPEVGRHPLRYPLAEAPRSEEVKEDLAVLEWHGDLSQGVDEALRMVWRVLRPNLPRESVQNPYLRHSSIAGHVFTGKQNGDSKDWALGERSNFIVDTLLQPPVPPV